MNCIEIESLIYQYLDKEIDESRETTLFAHLAECSTCREEFRLLSRIQSAYSNSLAHFPEQLDQRIASSLKKRGKRNIHSFISKPLPAYYLYAASIAILFMIAIYFFQVREFTKFSIAESNRVNMLHNKIADQEEHISKIIDGMQAVRVTAVTDNPNIIRKDL